MRQIYRLFICKLVIYKFLKVAIFHCAVVCLILFPFSAPIANQSAFAATDSFSQAIAQMQKGNFQTAIAGFTKAIALNTHVAAAYSNRCLAYLQIAQYSAAIKDCMQAQTANPKNIEAYLNRGLAYYRLGLYPQAIADYDQMLRLEKNDFRAEYNRGLAKFELKKYQEAIADYSHSIQLLSILSAEQDPRQSPDLSLEFADIAANIHNDRGLTYFALQDISAALDDYSRAIALNDRDDRAYYNRGCAYHRQLSYAKAIADLSLSLEINPHNPEAWFNQGLAKYALGHQTDAIADIQNAAQEFLRKGAIDNYQKAIELAQSLRSFGKTIFV
jgi:tetratricopeptide (TPR) repeat protein